MGVTIESYPVYNGAITLQNVYVNVRELRTTKEVQNYHVSENNENTSRSIYKLEFIVNYTFNENNVNSDFISNLLQYIPLSPKFSRLWDRA